MALVPARARTLRSAPWCCSSVDDSGCVRPLVDRAVKMKGSGSRTLNSAASPPHPGLVAGVEAVGLLFLQAVLMVMAWPNCHYPALQRGFSIPLRFVEPWGFADSFQDTAPWHLVMVEPTKEPANEGLGKDEREELTDQHSLPAKKKSSAADAVMQAPTCRYHKDR